VLDRMGHRNAFGVVRGRAGGERALADELASDPRVEYAEPNYLRQPDAVDPRLWAFFNPGGLTMKFTTGGSKGQVVSSAVSTADADEDNIAGYAAGGGAVVIGSIDTGVNLTHTEFLPGQLIAGKDWYSNDNDPSDQDDHGTHTTGTMVGRTVGVAGVSGAALNVKVYVQRVCGQRGCPTSAIVSAIRAAADYPGMVAVNMSLGGTSESQAEKDAIAYANSKNVLVIASAGNANTGTVECPACDPLAISVGATSWQDKKAYYSSWGPGLDISAPGGEMYSNTSSEGGIYSSIRSGYGYLQGTSMAAPQVTGTAGIVASVTGLRGSALRSRLESTTDDIGTSGYDTTFGNGRLNAYRAVKGTSLGSGL
jgi:subtilisin family serine protease